MIICSYCGFENIDGADVCESCHQSLVDEHGLEPATEVERSLLHDPVSVVEPRKKALSVSPDCSVRDAIQQMAANDVGCVVVLEGEKLVGVFTERDVLMKLNVDVHDLGDQPVSAHMSQNPQFLAGTDKLAFAVQRMDLGSFRHIPIVEGERVTGILSVRDILNYLSEKMRDSSTSGV